MDKSNRRLFYYFVIGFGIDFDTLNQEETKNNTEMKRIVFAFGLLLSLFLVTGCNSDDGNHWDNYPIGGLTMVNGYTGVNAVWYAVDGRLVQPPYYGITYKHYDFTRLYQGNRTIEVLANRLDPIVTSTRLQVKDNQLYTSFVGGIPRKM